MTYSELVRKLRRLGVELKRQAQGSHEIWWQPKTGAVTRIAHHEKSEIPTGTLRRILKDLDLTEDDLRNA